MRLILLFLFLFLFFPRSLSAQVLVSAKLDGKYGLLDTSGHWYLPATYDSLGTFHHQTVGYFVQGKWGVLHASGKVISPALWEEISYEEEGKIAVFDGNYWGFIDLEGKTIIEPQFLEADDFYEGLAGASKLEENWGFIDATGRWVIAPQFTFVAEFVDGKAYVEEDGEAYSINKKGKRLDLVSTMTERKRVLNDKRKMGIQNGQDQWLIPAEYDNISLRSGATYFFLLNGKWGLLDTFNMILFPNKLEQYRPFSDGLAPVKLNGKWGFIDHKGTMVVPAIFESAHPFSYGRAVVQFNGKWGAIGVDGNFLVPPKYELIIGGFQPVHPLKQADYEVELD